MKKKLEKFDDHLHSDIIYGSHSLNSIVQDSEADSEFQKFLKHKRLKEDCRDFRMCVERIITKENIASVNALTFATYIAREVRNMDVG